MQSQALVDRFRAGTDPDVRHVPGPRSDRERHHLRTRTEASSRRSSMTLSIGLAAGPEPFSARRKPSIARSRQSP